MCTPYVRTYENGLWLVFTHEHHKFFLKCMGVTDVQQGEDRVVVGGGRPLCCRLLARGRKVASWRR
jgi:hypothetical protein